MSLSELTIRISRNAVVSMNRVWQLILGSALASLCLLGISGCDQVAPTPEIKTVVPLENRNPVKLGEDDWPCWRGLHMDGIARGSVVPIIWSEKENVVWATPVPGRGHSSPVVVGSRVFLTTADEKARTQSVLCFDRKSGNRMWMTEVHSGALDPHAHQKNTQATPTVVCDGERVYAAFMFDNRVRLSALNLRGDIMWTQDIGNFVSRFGYSPSPLLYGPLIILAADHDGGGYIAGVDRLSGKIHWRTSRPAVESYATPSIVKLAGEDQLLIAGGGRLVSYDPQTGTELWSEKGTTQACVGSPVVSQQTVIASGGYPGKETLAVELKGCKNPRVLWRNTTKSYVPSLLAYRNLLFQVTDAGVASCWEISSGKKRWESRLGGEVSASPVYANGYVYLSSEQGITFVYKAIAEKYDLVSQNQLGNEQMASPAICGGRIYIRAAKNEGDLRNETLYCIGKTSGESPPAQSGVGGKQPPEKPK